MQCGADPEQLSELGAALRAAARTIDDVAVRNDRRLRSSGWRGPDAVRFDARWRSTRGDLARAAEACREQAARLGRHADEQLAASGSGASALALPSPPVSEVRYVGGVDLRLGPVVTTVAGDLSLQDLGGGRTRVVLAETVGVGGTLSAGAGASVTVADEVVSPVAATDGTADARLRVGAVQRRIWEVDDDDVDDVLTGVAAERLADGAPLSATTARSAAGLFDRATERLTGIDPGVTHELEELLSPPPPDRTELLAEVDVSAAAALAFGVGPSIGGSRPLGGSAATAATWRVGTARTASGEAARTSSVVEWTGTTNAGFTTTLAKHLGISLPDPIRSTGSGRLELGTAPDGSRQLDVRMSAISGSEIDDVAVRIELADDGPGSPGVVVPLMIEHLVRGDTAAAFDALRGLEVGTESVEVVASSGTVSGTSGRAGVAVAAGPGVGATLRGQRIEIDRGPTIGG